MSDIHEREKLTPGKTPAVVWSEPDAHGNRTVTILFQPLHDEDQILPVGELNIQKGEGGLVVTGDVEGLTTLAVRALDLALSIKDGHPLDEVNFDKSNGIAGNGNLTLRTIR